MRRSILLVTVAPLLLGGTAAPRCDCMAPPDVPQAFGRAAAVFAGRVISTSDGKIRISVERAWKGTEAGAVAELRGGRVMPDGSIWVSTCDYSFEVGKRYLVYAYLHEGELGTSICTRTTAIERAGREMAELDRLAPARAGSAQTQPPDSTGCR